MSRAQLKHVLLDVSFKDKPQVINLEAEFSPLGRLLYMDLLAAMSAATNARISRGVARVLGSRIGLDAKQVESVIAFCLENEMIHLEGDFLTNSRVIEDQEALFVQQEKWRAKNGKKKGEPIIIQDKSGVNPRLVQDTVNVHGSEVLNTEELNLNIIKEEPQATKAIARWVDHRRKIGKPLDQMAVDSLILLYRGKLSELPDDVDHSISNGWKTLNAKPKPPPPKAFKPPEPAVRRTINNYVPPTPEEKKRLTPEQVAANRKLIEEKLGKIKGAV